jgi:hypothetical protein
VIDEIHNLVERGRGYSRPSSRPRRRGAPPRPRPPAAAPCTAGYRGGRERARRARRGGGRERARRAAGGRRRARNGAPRGPLWRLRNELDAAFVDYLEHQRETKSYRADDPFVALYFGVLRFSNGLLLEGDALRAPRRAAGLGPPAAHPVQGPEPLLAGVISRTHATIGLSATLSPPISTAICSASTRSARRRSRCRAPSPPSAGGWWSTPRWLPPGAARRHVPRIAERLQAFAEAVPGNCPDALPSFQFLPTSPRGSTAREARARAAAHRQRARPRGAARSPARRAPRRRAAARGGGRSLRRGGGLPGRRAARGGGRRPLPAGADARARCSRPTTRSASSAASSTPSWSPA